MAFCSSCGTELPAGAQFCPKCGKPANEPAAQPGPSQSGPFDHMTRRDWRHMSREERRAMRREGWWSPEWALFEAIFGGLIVILLGALLYLAASQALGDLVAWGNFWAYLLLGLGVMLIARGLFGMYTRRYIERGNIVAGLLLVTIGAAGIALFFTGWLQYFWIAFIMAAGFIVIIAGIVNYLFRR